MPRSGLPYVNGYKDRTGKMRYYLRRPGERLVALSGNPGSRTFLQSYASATAKPPKPKRKRPSPVGQIYYLEDGEFIKIGFTVDWTRRRKAYQTHSAIPMQLLAVHPGTVFDEKKIHRKFKDCRASRREWFHRTDELLQHIRETSSEHALPNNSIRECLTTESLETSTA